MDQVANVEKYTRAIYQPLRRYNLKIFGGGVVFHEGMR
jgi:hypothetical protein